jgi:hypothetical protein
MPSLQNLNILGVSGLQETNGGGFVKCAPHSQLGNDPFMSSVITSRFPTLRSFNLSRVRVDEELLRFYESNPVLETSLRQVVLNQSFNRGAPWLRLIEAIKAKGIRASIIVLEEEIPLGYPSDHSGQHKVDDGVIKMGIKPSLGLDQLEFQFVDGTRTGPFETWAQPHLTSDALQNHGLALALGVTLKAPNCYSWPC